MHHPAFLANKKVQFGLNAKLIFAH